MESDLQAFSHVDLLRQLALPEVREIARRVRFREYSGEQSIVEHDEASREVYFVLIGRLRVTLFSRVGKEVAFRDLKAGESFGELAAIDGHNRSANVIALTKARVGIMAADAFQDCLRRYPDFAEATMLKLTALVRSLSDRVFEFSAPVPVRICIDLVRLARASMISENAARIVPAPKHNDIASRANTHREAVSRLMGELKKDGIVIRGKGELVVADVGALERRAVFIQTGD